MKIGAPPVGSRLTEDPDRSQKSRGRHPGLPVAESDPVADSHRTDEWGLQVETAEDTGQAREAAGDCGVLHGGSGDTGGQREPRAAGPNSKVGQGPRRFHTHSQSRRAACGTRTSAGPLGMRGPAVS